MTHFLSLALVLILFGPARSPRSTGVINTGLDYAEIRYGNQNELDDQKYVRSDGGVAFCNAAMCDAYCDLSFRYPMHNGKFVVARGKCFLRTYEGKDILNHELWYAYTRAFCECQLKKAKDEDIDRNWHTVSRQFASQQHGKDGLPSYWNSQAEENTTMDLTQCDDAKCSDWCILISGQQNRSFVCGGFCAENYNWPWGAYSDVGDLSASFSFATLIHANTTDTNYQLMAAGMWQTAETVFTLFWSETIQAHHPSILFE